MAARRRPRRKQSKMANPDHLKTLKQGVDAWNAWRAKEPLVRPEISGADLIAADLRRANLSGADLLAVDLSRADLSGANLERTSLFDARLIEANLRSANLNSWNKDPV